ncbi:MAG TPA: ABC transporter substrate-binding protein, partial [Octadecabacter sp.]|nr:ABC transporter substrate-binding protein [Octadecabacter sp.]
MKKTFIATTAALLASTAYAEVTIGNPMGMTGPIPDLVAPMAAAVDLAAQNINDQGGMFAGGEEFTVIRADSACDPVAAVDAVTKLINVNGVSAIVGPVCSGGTIAQAESVSIPAGVLTLSVSASSPAITEMEDGTDLVFRTTASDAYQGVALAELAMANGITDIAVSYSNDDYNAAISEVFATAFVEMGGTITANEAHEPNKASYRAEVATIGATSENVALFSYYGSGGITLMRNALETGAFTNFIGADGMLSDELIEQLGAENLENATFTT